MSIYYVLASPCFILGACYVNSFNNVSILDYHLLGEYARKAIGFIYAGFVFVGLGLGWVTL